MPDRKPRIWIIEASEPVPWPSKDARAMRAGQIASQLAAHGADVTWWTSAFHHGSKTHIASPGPQVVGEGLRLWFLACPPYSRNISLRRLRSLTQVARGFALQSRLEPRPDAILCCYPSIDLAFEASRFGQQFGVPVMIDIRDLWPDIFAQAVPLSGAIARALLAPLDRKARTALAHATGLSAISQPILEWGLAKAGRRQNGHDRVIHHACRQTVLSPVQRIQAEAFWQAQGLRLDGSEKIFGFFGSLSNVPEFGSAVAALDFLPNDLKASFRMVICGQGERLAWLQGQAARCHPLLVVPGHIGAAEIAVLMQHACAGLLIYPQRSDFMMSFPNE